MSDSRPLEFDALLARVRACQECSAVLPLGPRPILQLSPSSKILIAGQAPGRKVHDSGLPFDDASGQRLRAWMGISSEQFYRPEDIAIVPMGFCFPGSGASGDAAPRAECAVKWRAQLLEQLPNIQLTLVIGQYAQQYHLPHKSRSVTQHVAAWKEYWPRLMPLPHPSPRNNRWLAKNPWFDREVLPRLRARVSEVLGQ